NLIDDKHTFTIIGTRKRHTHTENGLMGAQRAPAIGKAQLYGCAAHGAPAPDPVGRPSHFVAGVRGTGANLKQRISTTSEHDASDFPQDSVKTFSSSANIVEPDIPFGTLKFPFFQCCLRKIPWRLSETRKANLKKRLREVDSVIQAVKDSGVKCHALTNAMELPTEAAMTPKDKFFVFSARSKGYRKGIHKVPHFTKITSRVNPKGF
ncbi:hypothetical protein PSTT_06830, partial [Puccinia striiformis]